MKTIVVSAVNIRKGGTLTILRQCLEYLSNAAPKKDYRVVAIVHKKALADYPHITYIEKPNTIKSWFRRLWCEYVTMHTISKQLAPVDLWLSLHDTTPRVEAARQAVYCQTSFPFLKFRWSDLRFNYKTVLFSLFTRYAYQVNIHRNRYLVVQAEWLRKGFSKMFDIDEKRFIVAPPEREPIKQPALVEKCGTSFTYFFPATPDCHKNFECLMQAAQALEKEVGTNRFQVIVTMTGDECAYARYLYRQYGQKVPSIRFVGFLSKEELTRLYQTSDALVFPSRVETWGLPISEFAATEKPMLLADLPYAHETAAGCKQVAFFDAYSPDDLKRKMKFLLEGETEKTGLKEVPSVEMGDPTCHSWENLFDTLLA